VTLGLGLNRVLMFVVDSQSAGDDDNERRVLNVYTLTVYRQTHRLAAEYTSGDTTTPPRACSLIQVRVTTTPVILIS